MLSNKFNGQKVFILIKFSLVSKQINNMKINFQVIDVKRLYFLANVHIFRQLWNSNFNVEKIIIDHICYSKQKFVPTKHKISFEYKHDQL